VSIHIAAFIVHRKPLLRVTNCIRDSITIAILQPAEWQRIEEMNNGPHYPPASDPSLIANQILSD
jgi:hypothetical protein